MPYPTPFPSLLDSTIVVSSRSCSRKAAYQYVDRLSPGPSVDLHFGGSIAAGMEAARKAYFVQKIPAREAENIGLNAASEYWGDFIPPPKKYESSKNWGSLLQTMQGYFAKWPLDSDQVFPLENVGIEFTFAIPMEECPRPDNGEPIVYAGRFDLLGTWHGMLAILDEKTQGKGFDDSWSRKWSLRNQFLMYLWACRQMGFPSIDKVIVRGISILKSAITFEEAIVTIPPYMIERAYIQTVRDINRFASQWKEGYFDYNFGDTCTAYGMCPFFDLCTAQSPSEWYPTYPRNTWNPLAKDPTEDKKGVA